MIQLNANNRHLLAPLFAEHAYLRTVICAILHHGLGTAITDNPNNPNVAKLSLGFEFLGGDATHPVATELVKGLQDTAVIPNPQWRDLIYTVHGDHVKIQQRYACDHSQLQIEHLQPLTQNHPTVFSIKQLDLPLAQQICEDVSPDLVDNFGSPVAFIKQGFGFCAIHNPSGRIACGASTYAVCGHEMEIEIDTHPDFRRLGLATAVAANLIIYSLQNNIQPHWDAHNPTSARLAQRLGYKMSGSYETYRITNNT